MKFRLQILPVAAALTGASQTAAAHSGPHTTSDFSTALTHWLSQPDHAAMLGIGVVVAILTIRTTRRCVIGACQLRQNQTDRR